MTDVNNYAIALNKAVGLELRKARRAADLTQEALAASTGLSKSTVIRIENGARDISTREIALVTEVVGVEPQQVMQDAQDRAGRILADEAKLAAETTHSATLSK